MKSLMGTCAAPMGVYQRKRRSFKSFQVIELVQEPNVCVAATVGLEPTSQPGDWNALQLSHNCHPARHCTAAGRSDLMHEHVT